MPSQGSREAMPSQFSASTRSRARSGAAAFALHDLHGGSFADGAERARSSATHMLPPGSRSPQVGVRVARAVR